MSAETDPQTQERIQEKEEFMSKLRSQNEFFGGNLYKTLKMVDGREIIYFQGRTEDSSHYGMHPDLGLVSVAVGFVSDYEHHGATNIDEVKQPLTYMQGPAFLKITEDTFSNWNKAYERALNHADINFKKEFLESAKKLTLERKTNPEVTKNQVDWLPVMYQLSDFPHVYRVGDELIVVPSRGNYFGVHRHNGLIELDRRGSNMVEDYLSLPQIHEPKGFENELAEHVSQVGIESWKKSLTNWMDYFSGNRQMLGKLLLEVDRLSELQGAEPAFSKVDKGLAYEVAKNSLEGSEAAESEEPKDWISVMNEVMKLKEKRITYLTRAGDDLVIFRNNEYHDAPEFLALHRRDGLIAYDNSAKDKVWSMFNEKNVMAIQSPDKELEPFKTPISKEDWEKAFHLMITEKIAQISGSGNHTETTELKEIEAAVISEIDKLLSTDSITPRPKDTISVFVDDPDVTPTGS